MDKKKVKTIIDKLSGIFTDKPALKFTTPYELLVAVILSAQCTDERVNRVTEKLFKVANTPKTIIDLGVEGLKEYIFSCGLYKTKAEHIISASIDILEKFSGQVPSDLQSLQTLAGVGRKTANVVFSVAFGGSAIAVDTHVFRVSNRIGIVNENNVLKTEKALMKAIDKSDWSRSHHYLIYLGRSYCKAQSPNCNDCPIKDYCEKKIKR